MAVQAQYPSNILLLNRDMQEVHDFCLQQPPASFLDQPSLFNFGGKGFDGFGQTMQPCQLISLSQLHNQPLPNVVSTGLKLSSCHDQMLRNSHSQQLLQQQNSSSPCSSSSMLTDDLIKEFNKQSNEMDQLFHAQGEQVKRVMSKKRGDQYRTLMKRGHRSISRKLQEKTMILDTIAYHNVQLEQQMSQLSIETQVWEAKAREHEATAVSLQAQLQVALNHLILQETRGDQNKVPEEDAESSCVDPTRSNGVTEPSCKACRVRVASMVALPCWHLCLCRECDQTLGVCPMCQKNKDSSIEVFLN